MREAMGSVVQAVRSLTRSRGFLAIALGMLVVGVICTTTVYSVLNALFYRDPPDVRAPRELIQLGRGSQTHLFDTWPEPYYDEVARRTNTLESVAAYGTRPVSVDVGGSIAMVSAQVVSPNFFHVLGTRLKRGTTFTGSGEESAVVVSDAFSRKHNATIGTHIKVAGTSFEIVGIAPSGFVGADMSAPPPDIWVTLAHRGVVGGFERIKSDRVSWLSLVARKKRGVTKSAVQAELSSLLAALEANIPAERRSRLVVDEGVHVRPDERRAAKRVTNILMGGALAVLLIACSNLATLFLTRASARRQEIAMRTVLGASRLRLVRQLLTETSVVAVAGSVIAFMMTYATTLVVAKWFPYQMAVEFSPDVRVLTFALLAAVVTVTLFSFTPLWAATRPDLSAVIGSGARSGARDGRFRSVLVGAQIALSFALLAISIFFLQTLRSAANVDAGYRTSGIVVASLPFSIAGDTALARIQLDRLKKDLASVAGVEAVSHASGVQGGGALPNRSLWPADKPPITELPPNAMFLSADTNYFSVLNIRFLHGRPFGAHDVAQGEPVVIVNRALARKLWSTDDVVDRFISFGTFEGEVRARVVGVVNDTRNVTLRDQPQTQLYLPAAQAAFAPPVLHLRVRRWTPQLASHFAERTRVAAPELPPVQFMPLSQALSAAMSDLRLVAMLCSVFAIVAFLIAAAGLYAAMAYSTQQRRREFALRAALGATPRDIVALVLRQAGRVTLVGSLLGAVFTIRFAGAGIVSVVALVITLSAVAATMIPALRAASDQHLTLF